MNLPDDFRDLLVSLVDAQVDFVIVGGFAVAHAGRPQDLADVAELERLAR